MKITDNGDLEIQAEIGRRLQRRRLQLNLSQAALAEISGVARKTVTNAENGRGCALITLIALLRGLGELDQLVRFLPDEGPSPMQLAKLQGKQRQRATGSRGKKEVGSGREASTEWKWGDE
ncbi:MAG: putative transcriptional regulator [Verrucomicrobiales bacterium]|jgi:putative transcriptional regulator